MKNLSRRIITIILVPALLLLLLTGCIPAIGDQPRQSQNNTNRTAYTADLQSKIIRTTERIEATPTAAVQLEPVKAGSAICHHVPLTVYLSKPSGISEAEYLVDELPEMPRRRLYVLAPETPIQLQLNLSTFRDRPNAASVRLDMSFSNSIADTDIGTIDVALTETSTSGEETIYYGQAKFVADCPKGITVSNQSLLIDFSHNDHYDIYLYVKTGQLAPTLSEITNQRPGKIYQAYGHPFDVVAAEETDLTDYLYPQSDSTPGRPAFLQHWSDSAYYRTDEAIRYQESIYRLPDLPSG